MYLGFEKWYHKGRWGGREGEGGELLLALSEVFSFYVFVWEDVKFVFELRTHICVYANGSRIFLKLESELLDSNFLLLNMLLHVLFSSWSSFSIQESSKVYMT